MQVEWVHIAVDASAIVLTGGTSLAVGYIGYKKIVWTLEQFRVHDHGEDDPRDEERFEKPLLVKGIRYPRNGGK